VRIRGVGGNTGAFFFSDPEERFVVELKAMLDSDFAWLLGEGPVPPEAPAICEDGVAPVEVVELIRGVAAKNREALGGDVAWLVVADGEAVGMISFTRPQDGKRPEIGYGIADSRQGRGHATGAVTALLPILHARGFDGLTAETGVDNRASQVVLAHRPRGRRPLSMDDRIER
jgi:RimJ/RimL family protein N-acetyltransferase